MIQPVENIGRALITPAQKHLSSAADIRLIATGRVPFGLLLGLFDTANQPIILDTAIELLKYAQALGAPEEFEKPLVTKEVTMRFSSLPMHINIQHIFSALKSAISRLNHSARRAPYG